MKPKPKPKPYILGAVLLVSLALGPSGPALAQSAVWGVVAGNCGYTGQFLEPMKNSFQSALSVGDSVVKPTIPAGTKVMIIQIETNDVRYTDDGTAVTTAVGTLVRKNNATGGDPGMIVVCRPNADFQMRDAVGGAAGIANISYYGVNQRNQ